MTHDFVCHTTNQTSDVFVYLNDGHIHVHVARSRRRVLSGSEMAARGMHGPPSAREFFTPLLSPFASRQFQFHSADCCLLFLVEMRLSGAVVPDFVFTVLEKLKLPIHNEST